MSTYFVPVPAGTRYGRLVVTQARGRGDSHLRCLCDCGVEKSVPFKALRKSKNPTISCGCAMLKHGHTANGVTSPTYSTWSAMINRCYYPSSAGYEQYGGMGVTVCQSWRESFASFLADMGERPRGSSIDRIDNARGYEPGNCRWATRSEQNKNKNYVRRTACKPAGHNLTDPANVYRDKAGHAHCKPCNLARGRRRRAAA